jgi:hypothetical protein
MGQKRFRGPSRDDLKNPDYTQVKNDLRRIALIAGSFVLIMIVLGILFR